jgi:hypothetical protein
MINPELEQAILARDDRPCIIHIDCPGCGAAMRARAMCEVPREYICENGHGMAVAQLPYGVTIDQPVAGIQHSLSEEAVETILNEVRGRGPDGLFEFVSYVGEALIRRFDNLNYQQLIYLVWQCVPNIPSREFGLMMAGVPMDLIAPLGRV